MVCCFGCIAVGSGSGKSLYTGEFNHEFNAAIDMLHVLRVDVTYQVTVSSTALGFLRSLPYRLDQ